MTRKHKRHVLVLDGDMVPALSVVRSLARIGVSVDIASHFPNSIASYSRYVTNKYLYPSPLEKETEFLQWCVGIVQENDYNLVIPVTERTMVPMQSLVSNPDIGPLLAIPPLDALTVALDKAATVQLANQLEIPVPQGHLIESGGQLLEIIDELSFPIVIKPSRSIGGKENTRSQLMVEYAFGVRELVARTQHCLNFGSVLIQEYTAGQGVGIELIADRGEIKYAFQHLRLHEVPLTGGGSSLRVSVPIEDSLLEAAKALVKALEWHGVAMVEFKWNPVERTFAIMEINGRFWGSLPLAVAAGADFPAMLFELLVDGKIQPRPPAKNGVYGRVLSRDIQWYEHVLRREAPERLFSYPSKRSMVKDLVRTFSFNHAFDVQQIRDPLPGLIDLTRIAGGYFNRIGNWLSERKNSQSRIRDWERGCTQLQVGTVNKILFLCYGNINRSALAERYFTQLVSADTVSVVSAGFHKEQNRPADSVMVDVAGDAGINMRDWSSKLVTRDMVMESDIIFVMEQDHYQKISEEYPLAVSKTFLMGENEASGGLGDEISDPYGKERSVYKQCVREITASVQKIVDSMPNKI